MALADALNIEPQFGEVTMELPVHDLPKYIIPEIRDRVGEALRNIRFTARWAELSNAAALNLFEIGNYTDAAAVFGFCCMFHQSRHGHPSAVDAFHQNLTNLAAAYIYAGWASKSVPILVDIVEYRKSAAKYDADKEISARSHLAAAYGEVGNIFEELLLRKKNLELSISFHGLDNIKTLKVRDMLAGALLLAGQAQESVRVRTFNLREFYRVAGKNASETLVGQNNLAESYKANFQFDKAFILHKKNLNRRRRVLGRRSHATIQSRNNLAGVCFEIGEMEMCIGLLERNIREINKGEDIPAIEALDCRNNLAAAYREVGRLRDAIRIHRRNLAECADMLGMENSNTIKACNNLAETYARAGLFGKAIRYHKEAIAMCVKTFGKVSLRTLTCRNNLAMSLRASALANANLSRLSRAEQLLCESLVESDSIRVLGGDALDRSSLAEIVTMSEMAHVLGNMQLRLAFPVSTIVKSVELGTARSSLDLIVPLKGQTVTSSLDVNSAEANIIINPLTLDEIRASIAPGQVMLLYGWCHLTATVTVITPVGGEECRSFLLFDTPDVKAEEARIGQVQAVAELIASGISPDIERLRAVEQAVALVRKDDALCLRLGNVVMDELPQLVTGLKNAWSERQKDPEARIVIRSMRATAVDALAREFMDFVLPTEARRMIAGASRVILIPSGPLHELPLDVLAGMAGVTELEGKPVVTAPSGSIYAMLKARKAGEGDYLPGIVGDPDIGPAESNEGREPGSPRSLQTIERELLLGDRANGFNRLPRAMQEAKDVAGLFSEKLGYPVNPLLDAQATVTAFYGESKDKRLLHVAAHAILGQPKDPMGSAVMLARDGEDSGLLRLDTLLTQWPDRLQGCDLVVLSCCQSGRGVKLGDSLMALPIGFFHAGVRCIVASLWKVDDIATWLLMRRFYENLLGQYAGENKLIPSRRNIGTTFYEKNLPMDLWTALAEAKDYLRKLNFKIASNYLAYNSPTPDEIKVSDAWYAEKVECPFAHPSFWAAFVIIGPGE